MTSHILRQQSTYWDFVDKAGIVRVHFLQKEEFYFSSSCSDDYRITENHPVLLNYQADWEGLYISSSSSEPNDVLESIVSCWEKLLQGWRLPTMYLNEDGAERILSEGYGKLMSAPKPLCIDAEKILVEVGISFTTLSERSNRWPRKALVAGGSFVIARDFRVERLAV